jgi:23S rRNA pseudouridine2605 synthase
MMRINKYLAMCGVSSRRGADQIVADGRVSVNDETVVEAGRSVDETTDVVRLDGEVVTPAETKEYILLNKPADVITTLDDPFERRTVKHLLEGVQERVYPVGRLDRDTEGVLLLTNDGELAHRLTHPRYQVKKIYEADVRGFFDQRQVEQIASGIKLEDGATGRAVVEILAQTKALSRIRLTLTEGRKREIRQMCGAVGNPVKTLVRLSFGGIEAGDLKLGEHRELTAAEVKQLQDLVGL